jgi:hypothetical protein
MKGLKHETDGPVAQRCQIFFRSMGDLAVVDQDLARRGVIQARKQGQQGGFAAAAAAGNDNEFPLFGRQGNMFQHGDGAVIQCIRFGNVSCFQQGHGGYVSPRGF